MWLRRSPSCPNCNQALTEAQLVRPSRFFINMHNALRLKCIYEECTEVIALEHLARHEADCQCRRVPCPVCQQQVMFRSL